MLALQLLRSIFAVALLAAAFGVPAAAGAHGPLGRPAAAEAAPGLASALHLAAAKVQPTAAPATPVDPQRRSADRKFVGMILGVLLHELGHALIGELGLPAVGPEEDVADEFASIMYIVNYKLDPEAVLEAALGSAEVWRLYEEQRQKEGWQQTPWFDEHAPDMVRYGKILCMFYGADPEAFADAMEAAGVPEDRRAGCIFDFQRKWGAWQAILRPYRRAIDPRLPGDQPADAPGGKVVVNHGRAYSAFAKKMSPVLQSLRVVESVAAAIDTYYVLPRDLRINLYDCGDENAWYSENDHAITLCYGLIALMSELLLGDQQFAAEINADSIPAIPLLTGSQPKPPTQSADTLFRTLVGIWQGTLTVGDEAAEVRATFNADGTFTQQIRQNGGFTVTVSGGWSLQAYSSQNGRLASFPTSWSPAEYCERQSQCQTLRFTPESTLVSVIDRNTVEVQGARLTRLE